MKVKKWGSMLVVFFSCCYYTSGVLGILLEWCVWGLCSWDLWKKKMEPGGVMESWDGSHWRVCDATNHVQCNAGLIHWYLPQSVTKTSFFNLLSHISYLIYLNHYHCYFLLLGGFPSLLISLTLSTFTINACSATLPDHAHPPTVYSLFILKPPCLMHSSTSPHPIVSLFFFLLKISYLNTI